jgi:hypothetical protein
MSHVAQEQKQEQEQGKEADRRFEGRSTAQVVQVVQGLQVLQVGRRRRSVLRTQEAMLTINFTVLTTKGTVASRLRPSRHFSVSPVCPPGASRILFFGREEWDERHPLGL